MIKPPCREIIKNDRYEILALLREAMKKKR